MTFPCYPKYKASGFIWLGDVPESWALKRLGHYFDERRERASDTEFEPLSVTKHGIVPRLESAAKTQDGDNRKKVRVGDFVINSRSDRKGSSGLSPLDGSVSLICTVLIPTGLHGPFIHHLFRSELFQEEYYRWGKGIVADLWSTNFSDMKNIVLGVPSEAEQTQIARFLDHETARIDALIDEQQRLIELLKEKRQAVISHAVTKGLDPTVPMKDSGVEWLGEVPAHWVVKKVTHACDIHNNLRTPIDRDIRANRSGVFPYYGPTGVLDYIDEFYVDGEYFLIGEDGDHFLKFEEKPMTFLVNGQFCVNNHAHLVRGKGSCSTNWAALYFESKDLFPWLIRQGVARYKLRKEALASIPIVVPPTDEQLRIVEAVDSQKTVLNRVIHESEKTIKLLNERRSALISAAVTGKIDVRGWQLPTSAPTPELVQEVM